MFEYSGAWPVWGRVWWLGWITLHISFIVDMSCSQIRLYRTRTQMPIYVMTDEIIVSWRYFAEVFQIPIYYPKNWVHRHSSYCTLLHLRLIRISPKSHETHDGESNILICKQMLTDYLFKTRVHKCMINVDNSAFINIHISVQCVDKSVKS